MGFFIHAVLFNLLTCTVWWSLHLLSCQVTTDFQDVSHRLFMWPVMGGTANNGDTRYAKCCIETLVVFLWTRKSMLHVCMTANGDLATVTTFGLLWRCYRTEHGLLILACQVCGMQGRLTAIEKILCYRNHRIVQKWWQAKRILQ